MILQALCPSSRTRWCFEHAIFGAGRDRCGALCALLDVSLKIRYVNLNGCAAGGVLSYGWEERALGVGGWRPCASTYIYHRVINFIFRYVSLFLAR
jgi:hypothetical protein